jgi:excinuclease ABC subunit C
MAAEEGSMNGLFSGRAFTGFGPPGLPGAVEAPLHVIRGSKAGRLRRRVREQAPRLPGVYGMVDASGELIYVGKGKCLRSRLLSYFRTKSRDPKAGRILRRTRLLAWEPAASELAALLRELELIQRWQPRFNVAGQPTRRRRTYVCVGRAPAPYVFLARVPPRTASAFFGPVPAGVKAREAVRRLNDWYRLRDCPQSQVMHFAEEQELFPILYTPGCLRHEIEQCLGPCARACTRSAYAAQVQGVLAFLQGRDLAPLEQLEAAMVAASAALEYERAAALRDRLALLDWLRSRLEVMRQASRQSFIYPVQGHDGSICWYLIHGGRARACLPAPVDDASRVVAARLVQQVYGRGLRDEKPGLEEVDGVLLMAGWLRRNAAERQKLLEPAAVLAELRS